jgi:hypothetical protein
MTLIAIDNQFIKIFKYFFKKYFEFEGELNEIHTILKTKNISEDDKLYFSEIKTIGKNDRLSIFNKQYHAFVDNESSFNEIYNTLICEKIKPLFQNEEILVVQKTPNLRISFPFLTAIGKNENDTDIIGLHCDSDFGHHYAEMNFIIPITKMFDTNSIYYEPNESSNIDYNDYLNLEMDTNTIFMQKLNKLKHYNKINTTNATRISLDFRVIPYSEYMKNIDYFKNTKFEIGKYYILK